MKIHSLLIVLITSTFTISTTFPWMTMAQGSIESINNNEFLTLATAQQVAAKITVRVRVGQGGGSGVLLAQKGGTYLVLTNAHVVQGQTGVSITTPDGLVHGVRRVPNAQVGDFDLALLEFNSARAYDLAKFANFENGDASLNEGRELFAAGFPYDANGLKLLEGKITQLPQEAFKNGTQVGYVTQGDLIQGMSGGPVLDSLGNLVGINSTLARPVIDNYVYADGSKAPDDKVAEYRQANWSVPMYNLLTRLNPDVLYSYQQLPKLHRSVTPTGYMAELDRKARAVTVRIEKTSGANGSGVIVAREGNIYYVLTNDHVVTKEVNGESKRFLVNVKVTTADQRSYEVVVSDIKQAVGTDLAIVKFTSSQAYQVATLGDYHTLDGIAFVGGWPNPKHINSQQWQWQLNNGTIFDKDRGNRYTQNKISFRNGYDLIYTCITYGGMSGGALFDTSGRVIGIHGKAEGNNKEILGQSLGLSIKSFIDVADELGVNFNHLQINTTPLISVVSLTDSQFASTRLVQNSASVPIDITNIEQWIKYGNHLYRIHKNTEAVRAFDRAIALKPNALNAYYGKGLSLMGSDSLAALTAFDKAIGLIPSKQQSNYYYLWKYHSDFLHKLKRYPEALMAISQAINLEPQDSNLLSQKATILYAMKKYSEAIRIHDEIIKEEKAWIYSNRSLLKFAMKDIKGAISDQSKAISINPQDDGAYSMRCLIKSKSELGDKEGAMSDCNKSISISPQNALNYAVRGIAKFEFKDLNGAISDYDKALSIDPENAEVYANRGIAKQTLGDNDGAVFDYDRAIVIESKFAEVYVNRGRAKFDLDRTEAAVVDYNKAISIDPENFQAHFYRGIARIKLGDEKGGKNDVMNSVRLFDIQN
jgi:tetratricopeptide (TPR) repeat protein